MRTIRVEIAGENTYGLRFHDFGVNAHAKGRYLFETFNPLNNRSNLAVPYEWNKLKGIKQWKVKPGTIIIKGNAAPQLKYGSQYIGGEKQWYINDLNDLLEP